MASAASRLHARELCPICQDPFADRDQVILSCEHAYHRSCLETFERFSSLRGQRPTCPVCRAQDYQKHLTHVGRETHREVCALQIQVRAAGGRGGRGGVQTSHHPVHGGPLLQSLYRGHVTRKQFHALRVEVCSAAREGCGRKALRPLARHARVARRPTRWRAVLCLGRRRCGQKTRLLCRPVHSRCATGRTPCFSSSDL